MITFHTKHPFSVCGSKLEDSPTDKRSSKPTPATKGSSRHIQENKKTCLSHKQIKKIKKICSKSLTEGDSGSRVWRLLNLKPDSLADTSTGSPGAFRHILRPPSKLNSSKKSSWRSLELYQLTTSQLSAITTISNKTNLNSPPQSSAPSPQPATKRT